MNASSASAAAPIAKEPSAERQLRDLQIILEVTRAMTATVAPDQLLELILDAARRVFTAERATLFMYDSVTDELYSRFTKDTDIIRFPADRGIAGAVARSRQTLNIPDAYADPRFNREVDRKTGYRTRCMLTVPLVGLDDRLVGVMQVLNKVDDVFAAYDERLAEALGSQIAVTLQRSALQEHYVHKKELERSLAIARDIQQSLLPKTLPRLQDYDLAGWSRPADETGGDYYDFLMLPNGGLAITLADVTGHGIGPALIVAETRALLRAVSGEGESPDATLARANRWLADDLTGGRFVTTFYGILDSKTHRLEYASAGHGPLFWYRAETGQVVSTGSTGFPLGLSDPMVIECGDRFDFHPGDAAILLTDGFPEAQDVAGRFFTAERVAEVIAAHAQRPAAELIGVLEQEVCKFMAGGPQLDDLTAVIVKRTATK